MRLMVLGGTRFLGRHVATAALERGHDVATFTRGVSGEPPEGVHALHGDRDDPAALPRTPPRCWATSGVTPSSAASTPTATGRRGRSGARRTTRPGPRRTTST